MSEPRRDNPDANAACERLQAVADSIRAGVTLEILYADEYGDAGTFVLFAGGYEVEGVEPMTEEAMRDALTLTKGVIDAAFDADDEPPY